MVHLRLKKMALRGSENKNIMKQMEEHENNIINITGHILG